MGPSQIHQRLHTLLGDETYRSIGERTGHHPENVRRYMQGQVPPIQFLAAVCAATGASADWLLSGKGPMRAIPASEQLDASNGPERLLASLARTVESLADRLDRVERYAQTLETRLRAAHSNPEEAPHDPSAQSSSAPDRRQAQDPNPASIADALSKRSRPPAG